MSNLLQRRGNSIYILIREYMKKNISNNQFIYYLLFIILGIASKT